MNLDRTRARGGCYSTWGPDADRHDKPLIHRTRPTGTVLPDAGYFTKGVTLNLALRSSSDAGRGFGRVRAAATLVADDQTRIVEETLVPGAKMTDVARRNGVAASVVFTWRRQARTVEKLGPCFAPVQITAAAETGVVSPKPPSENDGRLRLVPAARTGRIGWRRASHIASRSCPSNRARRAI
jgi:hypothetical protein